MMKTSLGILLLLSSLCTGIAQAEAPSERSEVSASAIGWGNLLVPGLGATLRGYPGRGLLEASAEIGTFYGGTFGAKEGDFSVDGTVSLPRSGNIFKPTTGQMLQQFGLKLHMYDTFYHYQQAAIEQEDSDREKNNPQPIYRGDWLDTLSAPFQWKNLSSIWTYPYILGGTIFLLLDYQAASVKPVGLRATPFGNTYFAASQIGVIPIGSAFGEDVFFRGFVQREVRGYTHSLALSVGFQSALFSLGHDNKLGGLFVGTYYGIMADQLKGELGPAIASHFWLDVVDGFITYWTFLRAQGKSAPFNSPVVQVRIPI